MSERHLPELRVQLFGGPALFQGDEEVPLSPFQSYLLALVYAHGARGISRSKAAWLLWEMDDDRRTRHRLSQLAHKLKRKVGGRAVVRRKSHRLVPGRPEVGDDCLGPTPTIPELLRIPQGAEFLHLFPATLPTKALEDWTHATRITQRRRYIHSLGTRLQEARAAMDIPGIIDLARRLLQESPTDSNALRHLVSSLILQGEHHEAKRQVEQSTAVARITSPDWSPPSDILRSLDPGTKCLRPSGIQIPLIGRGADLRNATDALLSTSEHWTTLVLSGDAGIGKTRLLAELQLHLQLHGHRLISVRCHEAEKDISFNIMADIVQDEHIRTFLGTLSTPWHDICSHVFPLLANDRPSPYIRSSEAAPNARSVHDALEHLFSVATEERGLTILIDDAHWMDSSSLSALSFLRRRLSRHNISLVLSVIMEGLTDEHPATSFLKTLDGEHDTWKVLRPLARTDIDALLLSAFPEQLSDDERHAIADISMGVPLFALELGSDRVDGVRSRTHEPLTTTKSADALFKRRQSTLEPRSLHVLRLLSVLARPISYEGIMRCAGLRETEFVPAIEELHARRLISSGGARMQQLEVRHQLIQGAIYNDLSHATRRMYHESIAQFLKERSAMTTAAELAFHFHAAGLDAQAHEYAVLAADQASKKGAFAHVRRMLELAVSAAQQESQRFSCLRRLGLHCFFQGSHAEAVTHFDRATTIAEGMDDWRGATEARMAAIRARIETDNVELLDCDREMALLGSEARARGEIHTYLTTLDLSMRIADYAFDSARAKEVLADVDSVGTAQASAKALCLWETIRTRHICYGDPNRAVAAARSAVHIAQHNKLGGDFGRAVKRFIVVLSYRGLLDGEEGKRHVDAAIAGFRRTGELCGVFDVLINYGAWLTDTGRFDEARGYLNQAADIVRDLEDSPEYAVFSCNMGELLLYQRDYLSARQYYRRAWRAGSSTRRVTAWVAAGGLGLCALETGDLSCLDQLDASIPSEPFLLENPTFDPTPIALFRARRLEVRRMPHEAANLLHNYGTAFRERIIPAWLKIRIAEVELRRKHRMGGVTSLAGEAYAVASDLGLRVRARQFEEYLS